MRFVIGRNKRRYLSIYLSTTKLASYNVFETTCYANAMPGFSKFLGQRALRRSRSAAAADFYFAPPPPPSFPSQRADAAAAAHRSARVDFPNYTHICSHCFLHNWNSVKFCCSELYIYRTDIRTKWQVSNFVYRLISNSRFWLPQSTIHNEQYQSSTAAAAATTATTNYKDLRVYLILAHSATIWQCERKPWVNVMRWWD